MNLFKVKLIDPAVSRKNLVTIFLVAAKTAKEAEQMVRQENESAFSKQPQVEVTQAEGRSVKLASFMQEQKKEEPPREKLAATFASTLREEIGTKNFAEMQRRNRKEKRRDGLGGVCHSHDFCDANMVMYAAFQKVTGKECVFGSEDVELWNEAWNLAFVKFLGGRR